MLDEKDIYASRRVFASHRAHFVYLFVWLVVASSRCASSSCPLAPPRHIVLRRVGASCLVSSSCLVFASRLVITSLLITLRRTHFFWLVVVSASRRCIPSSRPLARVIIASCLVITTHCLPSRCLVAAFCLFGCRVTYSSTSISTLVAQHQHRCPRC